MSDLESPQPSPRSPDPLGLSGRVLGGAYRVTTCVGRGGMGVVYLAKQIALDRDVVIKLVAVDADEDSVARFQREARSLSRLSHPNVVQVIDYGRDADSNVLYIVMEYVRGITLGRYLKQRVWLPTGEFRWLADQLLAGVAEAHRSSLVHRDLKPSNIMLVSSETEGLRVKLLDFGLSKLSSGDEPLTRVNQVVGSAMYMAPEQIRGRSVDARADVYTLGVLFYQMLSGAKPYTGEDHELFAQQVGGQFVPLGQALPHGHDVPYELVDLIERCLSADPDRRPADARHLQRLLDVALSNTPSATRHDLSGTSGSREVDAIHSTSGTMDSRSMSRSHPRPEAPPPHPPSGPRYGLILGTLLGVTGLLTLLVVLLLLAVVVVGGMVQQTPPGVASPASQQSEDEKAAEVLRSSALAAMQQGEYERSVNLLTEAVRLAPEQGDLKDLLVIVVDLRDREKPGAGPAPAPAPETTSARPAPPRPAPGRARAAPRPAPAVQEEPDPPAPAPVATGIAVVTSTPSGLAFQIADLASGFTPARVDLPPGTWPVKLSRDGVEVHATTVTIGAGEVGIVTAEIAPPPPQPVAAPAPAPAPVAVTPAPAPAPVEPAAPASAEPAVGQLWIESPNLYGEVLVNGRPYGYAPVKITVPVGPAEIQIRVGKTVRRSQSVVVGEGENHVVVR